MLLTDQQRAVVEADGNFLLLACPGSGKTRSAAERAARLVRTPGAKIAVCSYTNVGAQRIGAVLANELRVVLEHRHFIGTIHRFLLRYVLNPYAHLLGAQRGPYVHDGDWPEVYVYGDKSQRIALDKFRYKADGTLLGPTNPRGITGTDEEILASVETEVRNRKGGLFTKGGIVSADDAMWLALHILRKYEGVATAVAGRFDELMLDEAQDTSELQLACIEALHQTGRLRSLVLVGDLEQSIYSFMGADVERLKDLAKASKLDTLPMTENHRSSQLICDVAKHFCGRGKADTAVGQHKDCSIQPEVLLYPAKDPRAAMDSYRARLEAHHIGASNAAVLARNWSVVDALNGRTLNLDEGSRQYRLGQIAAHLAAGKLTRADLNAAQRMLAYCAWDISRLDELDDEQRAELRTAAGTLLARLPPLSGDLRAWLTAARAVLHEFATALAGTTAAHAGGHAVVTKVDWANHAAADVFAGPARDLAAQTVHAFKGEDSEAVMVVVRRMLGNDPTAQMELWEAAVDGLAVAAEKAEERRVIFVALTRAQRYCVVALPDDRRGKNVATKCQALGFKLVTP